MSSSSYEEVDHDPSRAKTKREKFEAETYNRWREAKGIIRETIVDNDALRLETMLQSDSPTVEKGSNFPRDTYNRREHERRVHIHLQARDDFGFNRDADKHAAFMRWVREMLNDDVVERSSQREIHDGQHWTGAYIRTASRQGIANADQFMAAENIDFEESSVTAVMRQDIHQDVLENAYLRTYEELEGISEEVSRQLSRELSQGLAEGVNPREAARRINDRVDSVGIDRSRTMARTEFADAQNRHTARRYQSQGVEEVRVLTTDPCQICRRLARGSPYPIDEAETLLPARTHPNCRCTIIPA